MENQNKDCEYKSLEYRLYNNNSFYIDTNTSFTVEEVVGLIVDLELFCCQNLGVHPFLLHTASQNLLTDIIFNNQGESTVEIVEDENIISDKISESDKENKTIN